MNSARKPGENVMSPQTEKKKIKPKKLPQKKTPRKVELNKPRRKNTQ